MSTILSRIKEMAEKEHITIGALEKKIGASKGVLSRAIANSSDIQAKWLQVLVDNYPEYSTRWLLTGRGPMLACKQNDKNDKNQAIPCNSSKGIPLIPFDAMAGIFNGEINVLDYECEKFIIPALKDADFMIRVNGLSMLPKYAPGDLVACKKLPIDTFFQWNKVYVVDTDQGPIIKRIRKGSTPETLLIVSDNPDYDKFELSRSCIYHIALVIGGVWLE